MPVTVIGDWGIGSAVGGGNPVTDNFNRGDVDPIGGNWTTLGTWGNIAILGNIAKPSSYGTTSAVYYNAATPTATQYAQCTITAYPGAGPAVRMQAGASTCYALYSATSAEIDLFRFNAAAFTSLNQFLGLSLVLGDVIKLAVSGTGATVTLELFINGVSKGTYDDTAAGRITAAGSFGIYIDADLASGGVDNWEGGWS